MGKMIMSGKGKGLTKRQYAFGTGITRAVGSVIDVKNRKVKR